MPLSSLSVLVAQMKPLGLSVPLDYALVIRLALQPSYREPDEPVKVVGLQIRRIAAKVRTCHAAPHFLVEFRTPVAARDPYRLPPRIPQRLQQIVAQLVDMLNDFGGRDIVNPVPLRRGTERQFFEREILTHSRERNQQSPCIQSHRPHARPCPPHCSPCRMQV